MTGREQKIAVGVAVLALAGAGVYALVSPSEDDGAPAPLAGDHARSAPRTRSSSWSPSEARPRRRETVRAVHEDGGASGAAASTSVASPSIASAPPSEAPASEPHVPAARRPLPTPLASPERDGPVPAERRLRSSQALARLAEQRLAELTTQLEAARQSGNAARAAHIEREIARVRGAQPRIEEHVEATRREVEASP